MITQQDAQKKFEEQQTLTCMPNDTKRLIIPAFGFTGAIKTKRPEYLPPDYKQVMLDTEGLEFTNPKDGATQVLKQEDGCLICYDKPGLKDKVDAYINAHPDTFKTAKAIQEFLKFLLPLTVDSKTGKADVYDTDIAFASGLVGAPPKGKIVPGQTFAGVKKKECVKAFYVKPGTEFEGPTGTPQVADKKGAFVLSDKNGMRMIQFDEFHKVYTPDSKVVQMTHEETYPHANRSYPDITTTTQVTIAGKHVLQTTLRNIGTSNVLFDGNNVPAIFKDQGLDAPDKIDWPATYNALKTKNPEMAEFIASHMFSTEEKRKFGAQKQATVNRNAAKVKKAGRGLLTAMKAARRVGLLKTSKPRT